jgi:multiple sugar transport system substrate-binding protein
LWLFVVIIVITMITGFTLIGCKTTTTETTAAATTTAAGETTAEVTTAAAETTAAAKEVTLTIWKPSWGDVEEQYMTPLLKKFEAENPGVTIKYDYVPWEGVTERFLTSFTAGNPPDIFYLPDSHWPKFAASGYLADLTKEFPNEVSSYLTEFQDKWVQSGVFNGDIYGIPFVNVGISIEYNKDLFDAAGVPYPPAMDSPDFKNWTYDAFVDAAKKLTNASKDQWGFAWSANAALAPEVWTYCYMWQQGVDVINKEGNGAGFDNDKGLAGFKFMNDMVNTYKFIAEQGLSRNFQDYFYSGKAAMCPFDCYQAVALVKDHPELNVGAVPWPQGPGTELLDGRGQHANVGYMLMSQNCKNKDVAFKLIKFITAKENAEAYINAVGLFGCRKDYEMKIDDPKALELFKIHYDSAFKYGHPFQLNAKFYDAVPVFTSEIQAMLQGQKSPDQGWKDAVTAVNGIFK